MHISAGKAPSLWKNMTYPTILPFESIDAWLGDQAGALGSWPYNVRLTECRWIESKKSP